jgi:NDP-sugar pyrophosphorylase family protein
LRHEEVRVQCLILAGGLGTRMWPLTRTTPKTLLPVAGVSFAHYQLSWLAGHGVREVVYSIGALGEQVRDFAGDGSRWGLRIAYVEDGPTPAGTGGALRRAFDAGALRDWFLVLYGDSFLPFDFRALARAFLEQPRPALMAVYRNQGRFDTGNARYADGVVARYQKSAKGEKTPEGMDYIDYGVTALRSSLVGERIPPGAAHDLSNLCHRLSLDGLLGGFEVSERFYEIGSPDGLADFAAWVAQHPVESWPRR